MTDTSSIRQEMAQTRSEMARDIEELEHRASERVQSVKQRLDVGKVIRENPWPALGAAVALGAIVAGSGADKAAASATASAAKKASRATADAAKQAAQKLHSHEEPSAEATHFTSRSQPAKPGIMDRLFDGIGLSIAGGLDRVLDEMRVASRDWGARIGGNQSEPVSARAPRPGTRPAMAPVVATAIVVAEELRPLAAPSSSADDVPLPNEIAPAELGARRTRSKQWEAARTSRRSRRARVSWARDGKCRSQG
jgi:hypothetical protein